MRRINEGKLRVFGLSLAKIAYILSLIVCTALLVRLSNLVTGLNSVRTSKFSLLLGTARPMMNILGGSNAGKMISRSAFWSTNKDV